MLFGCSVKAAQGTYHMRGFERMFHMIMFIRTSHNNETKHLEDSVSVAMLLTVLVVCLTFCFAFREILVVQV
jgi:hypothetical protein